MDWCFDFFSLSFLSAHKLGATPNFFSSFVFQKDILSKILAMHSTALQMLLPDRHLVCPRSSVLPLHLLRTYAMKQRNCASLRTNNIMQALHNRLKLTDKTKANCFVPTNIFVPEPDFYLSCNLPLTSYHLRSMHYVKEKFYNNITWILNFRAYLLFCEAYFLW